MRFIGHDKEFVQYSGGMLQKGARHRAKYDLYAIQRYGSVSIAEVNTFFVSALSSCMWAIDVPAVLMDRTCWILTQHRATQTPSLVHHSGGLRAR